MKKICSIVSTTIVLILFLGSCNDNQKSPSFFSAEATTKGTTVAKVEDLYLCPTPDESNKAFRKLTKSIELKGSIAEHTLPTDNQASIEVAMTDVLVRRLSETEWLPAIASPQANLNFGNWFDVGSSTEMRSILVTINLEFSDGEQTELSWSVSQEREILSPKILKTMTTEITRVMIGDSADALPYSVMRTKSPCNQDAYQGLQEGTVLAPGVIMDGEKKSRKITIKYKSKGEHPYGVKVEGRTGISGFDKTMHMAIDQITFEGLLNRSISVMGPSKAVHAAGHHNWSDEYVGDLEGAKDLTDEENSLLRSRGLRYVLIRPITAEEALKFNVVDSWNVSVLEGYDADLNNPQVLGPLFPDIWGFEPNQ